MKSLRLYSRHLLGLFGLLLLSGCYVFSYYPETDTYVTTVETKKYVNRNYSRERFMEPNNSDCYACHNSVRNFAPQHGGYMHGQSMMDNSQPQGHPPTRGQMAPAPQAMPSQQPQGFQPPFVHMVPGVPAGPNGANIPSYGAIPQAPGGPQMPTPYR